MPPDYGFPRVGYSDLPLLRAWLDQPHVRQWWTGGEDEIAHIAARIGGDETDMRLVTLDGTPFAYVQDYAVDPAGMPYYADLPAGSRGMDTFLGDPAFLRQGHGRGYLAARAAELLAGAPVVAADPSPDNIRAVRTWRAAGFSGSRVVTGDDGQPALVLTRRRDAPPVSP